MSLYVGIFRGDAEVEGWVVGQYSDFGYFRDVISQHFEPRELPLLLQSSDCEAAFSPPELPALRAELARVRSRFSELPPVVPNRAFEHNQLLWSRAGSLLGCFHNVDGEPLVDALIHLAERGIDENAQLLFQ